MLGSIGYLMIYLIDFNEVIFFNFQEFIIDYLIVPEKKLFLQEHTESLSKL